MARSHTSARYVHTLHLQAGSRAASRDLEEHDLRDQIAELEERIRTAPESEGRRRANLRDLVPPPAAAAVVRRSAHGLRLTKQEQQLVARERRGHIVVSLLLVTMLVGLLNWLAHLLRA